MTEVEIRELLDASMTLAQEGGRPQDMWLEDYGWILTRGEITDQGRKYLKDLRARTKDQTTT